jgi:hypothetical protein
MRFALSQKPAVRAGFCVLALLVSAFPACSTARTAEEPSIDAVRAATQKYRDVDAAIADGYVRDVMDNCETPAHMGVIDDLGARGIHFLRPDLLGIEGDETRLDVTRAHVDFLQPSALLYEPQADKTLELVAISNTVSAEAWAREGHTNPPTYQGTAYRYTPDNVGMGTKAWYELQVWLYRENPAGMFAPYNPNATCAHHEYNMPMIHPPIDLLPGETRSEHEH